MECPNDCEHQELKEAFKKVKQHNRDMMNVLADLEWTDETVSPKTCPYCLQYQPGHDVSCKLKKVLHGF